MGRLVTAAVNVLTDAFLERKLAHDAVFLLQGDLFWGFHVYWMRSRKLNGFIYTREAAPPLVREPSDLPDVLRLGPPRGPQSALMLCACFVIVISKTPLLKVQVRLDVSTGSGISRIFQ
jgi:hypothetical protein